MRIGAVLTWRPKSGSQNVGFATLRGKNCGDLMSKNTKEWGVGVGVGVGGEGVAEKGKSS